MQRYIKLSTAFVVFIGGLVPLTMPSLADSPSMRVACVAKSDSVTVCETLFDDGSLVAPIRVESPTICMGETAMVVCGPISDFAHGIPVIDTSNLPKLFDNSCYSSDCLILRAKNAVKAEKAYEKRVKADNARALKAEKAAAKNH